MDLHQLRTDIKTAQSTDPTCIDGLTKANDGISNWTIDDDGLLWQNNCLWIPNALDLRLQILQHHHDHIISGHFRQNCTLAKNMYGRRCENPSDIIADHVQYAVKTNRRDIAPMVC